LRVGRFAEAVASAVERILRAPFVIVVHGNWLPKTGRFFLWAETQGGAPAAPPDHPYQLPMETLVESLLLPLADPDSRPEALERRVTLVLPTEGDAPLASPELLFEREASSPRERRLAPWRVSGLTLSPEAALDWLVMLPTPEELDPHRFRLGAGIRYWSVAARFALELLARQRFLPALVPDEEAMLSRWEPLVEQEIDRFDALLVAMPPMCRALSPAEEGALTSDALLRSFLSALVDRFIRRAASRLRLKPRFVESMGEELLASLVDGSGVFEGGAGPAEALVDWKAQLEEEEVSPFRIAFRLDPPLEPEAASGGDEPVAGAWELRFFLQAVDDESLLVPVARVWEHGGTTWRYLERFLSRPQEMVLEGLGRAATLFPPIEDSLKESRPESCPLDLDQAYAFLKEGAYLLRESGFGILLPSWWGKRERGVGLSLRVTPSPSGPRSVLSPLGLEALVEFDWQVALGGQSLPREEFLELAQMKQPLVRVRGQWVELSPERVEEVLQALQARPESPKMTLGDVLQLELGRPRDGSLPVTDLEATGWIETLLTRLAGREELPHLEAPRSFLGKLRPYQKHGLSWLSFLGRWNLGACLADDMGLGKTIQVLALLLHLDDNGELDRPVLLICPTSVVSNWRKEAERFAPTLRVLIHHGQERHEGERFQKEAARHHLVVSTYSLVHRDLERLSGVEWEGLVLDEAQNIKNPQAKQTRALRKLAAPRRIALTGTPVENRLSELWSIMEFLNPGYLGSEAAFRRRYALPIERYRDPSATTELRKLVEPFILRRVKTDPTVIKDLPSKNEMKVYCSLTQEQATLYQAVVSESLEKIEASEGIGRKGEVLAALTRLKQICNHPAHFLADGSSLVNRSGKLTRLTEMLEELLAEGDRALVFTQYAEMGKLIQRHLREALSVDVLFLHGAVPATARERLIGSFQDDREGPPVFVLSLKAGGFGLNLTEARHVFHYDRWWNPAVEDQATDRAFRIGQKRSVAVYKFICAGTVEERVDELAERKKELAQAVIQSGEGFITELSTESLRDLFALRKEAVEV
jgi:SNF2 family DNA or RNA helicase